MSTKPAKRSLETAEVPAESNLITSDMKRLAKEFYFENKAANEAANKAKKARTALFAAMSDAAVKAFDVRATDPDTKVVVVLDVEIKSGRASSVVDIAKLRELVADDEKLLKAVTVTQKSIVDNFGSNMADRVTKSVPGDDAVQVSPRK